MQNRLRRTTQTLARAVRVELIDQPRRDPDEITLRQPRPDPDEIGVNADWTQTEYRITPRRRTEIWPRSHRLGHPHAIGGVCVVVRIR